MNPVISVVIPTFNRRETLERVLPLLANQTLPADQYELLLCDSGSTDGTAELLAELAIPNLRHIRPAENRGRSGARNAKGLHWPESFCYKPRHWLGKGAV